jgi:hypothetical protein
MSGIWKYHFRVTNGISETENILVVWPIGMPGLFTPDAAIVGELFKASPMLFLCLLLTAGNIAMVRITQPGQRVTQSVTRPVQRVTQSVTPPARAEGDTKCSTARPEGRG